MAMLEERVLTRHFVQLADDEFERRAARCLACEPEHTRWFDSAEIAAEHKRLIEDIAARLRQDPRRRWWERYRPVK